MTLTLAGPGLGVLGPTSFNGAGVDFSTLSITPEQSTWVLLVAGAAFLAGRRRFLSSASVEYCATLPAGSVERN